MTNKAQVTLELTFCIIILVMLLMGTFAMFIWFGRTMVERQMTYRETGISLESGQFHPEYFTPNKMDLFNEYY